ncbi:hypothetical protein C0991_011874, partial [Blastosporella zonata]
MKFTSAFAALALSSFTVKALPSLSIIERAKVVDGIRLISRSVDLRIANSVDSSDTAVLNFALTLEHLENAFYIEGLAKYDEQAFAAAGYPPFVRGRFTQIAAHEKTHVKFLSDALANKATQPCVYNFPYNDVKSFVALSQALEGVGTIVKSHFIIMLFLSLYLIGVTAYSGAAQFITNKDYLTAAATVLSTEARHASWIASAVSKFSGWSSNFD